MDTLSKAERSALMARVKSRNSLPELKVRSMAHRLGYRFRLHRRDLPGTPDIVFPKWKTVIFVHGCFWHRHSGCRLASNPKSNVPFWANKFSQNVERDRRIAKALRRQGWRVKVVWECQTRRDAELEKSLRKLFTN
jgi:DNA mismatch endonuclease (patch repair protein)